MVESAKRATMPLCGGDEKCSDYHDNAGNECEAENYASENEVS